MLDQLKWSANYETGHKAIDAQHQWLFDLAERVRGAGTEKTKKIIRDLSNYTRMHFHKEEELMMEMAYPKISEHRVLHGKLCERLEQLAKVGEEKSEGVELLLEILMEWVRDHILQHDMDFIKYYKAS